MAKYTGGGAGGSSGLGEALGRFLGRGGERLGEYYKEKIKPKWTDDKGLFRGNPDGLGRPIMGTKAGIDSWQDQEGLVQQGVGGNYRLGSQAGVDNPDEGLFQQNQDGGLRLGKYQGIDFLKDNKGMFQNNQYVSEKNPFSLREAYKRIRASAAERANPTDPSVPVGTNVGMETDASVIPDLGGDDTDFIGPTENIDNLGKAITSTGETQPIDSDHFLVDGKNIAFKPAIGRNLMMSKVQNPNIINTPEEAFQMQKFLSDEGYDIAIDGKWGDESTQAMARWMKARGTGNTAASNFFSQPLPGEAGYGSDLGRLGGALGTIRQD